MKKFKTKYFHLNFFAIIHHIVLSYAGSFSLNEYFSSEITRSQNLFFDAKVPKKVVFLEMSYLKKNSYVRPETLKIL